MHTRSHKFQDLLLLLSTVVGSERCTSAESDSAYQVFTLALWANNYTSLVFGFLFLFCGSL